MKKKKSKKNKLIQI